MYLNFYQLKEKPFRITCDPRYLWLSENHKEAIAMMNYGLLDSRGGVLLTGAAGVGKTILINYFIAQFDEESVVAALPDPGIDKSGLYGLLVDAFKLPKQNANQIELYTQIREFLLESASDGRKVLLIIDEAQRLGNHQLEDLLTLSNIENSDQNLITWFLFGRPEFRRLLALKKNRALSQYITMRYEMAPLGSEAVGHYIRHRLEVAGATEPIFTDRAIEKIGRHARGLPLLINMLCDRCLVTSHVADMATVDESIVDQSAKELAPHLIEKKTTRFSTPSRINDASCTMSERLIHLFRNDSDTAGKRNLTDGTGMRHHFKLAAVGLVPLLVIFGVLALMRIENTNALTGFSQNAPAGVSDTTNSQIDGGAAKEAPSQNLLRNDRAIGNQQSTAAAVSRSQRHNSRNAQPFINTILVAAQTGAIPIVIGDRNQIDPSSMAAMELITEKLENNPMKRIEIQGVIGETNESINPKMAGDDKMIMIKEYFIREGVDPYRIKLVDAGNERGATGSRGFGNKQWVLIKLQSKEIDIDYNFDK